MPRHIHVRAAGDNPADANAQEQQGEFRETHVKTRRVIRQGGEVVYGADVETTSMPSEDQLITESHTGGLQAACGCLISGELKPRFHRDGTMVCANHYYFCAACGSELLPLEMVVLERRVYCKMHGEEAIDEIVYLERRAPGTFEKSLVAHLNVQKRRLRSERWKNAFRWLFGRRELGP